MVSSFNTFPFKKKSSKIPQIRGEHKQNSWNHCLQLTILIKYLFIKDLWWFDTPFPSITPFVLNFLDSLKEKQFAPEKKWPPQPSQKSRIDSNKINFQVHYLLFVSPSRTPGMTSIPILHPLHLRQARSAGAKNSRLKGQNQLGQLTPWHAVGTLRHVLVGMGGWLLGVVWLDEIGLDFFWWEKFGGWFNRCFSLLVKLRHLPLKWGKIRI